MTKPTDIRLCSVKTSKEKIDYRTPIKFGGRVVLDVVLMNVEVEVETIDGRRGVGFGSMPVGNVWAWPSSIVSASQSLEAMIVLAEQIAESANTYSDSGHALNIATDLAGSYEPISEKISEKHQLGEPIPKLAQLVSASPLEAAIFDAQGKAVGANTYDILSREFVSDDLSHWLGSEYHGEYLDRYTLRQPKDKMPLYHLVGALDPLTDGDIENRIDDGLPETLPEWILADGLTHMKIKLNGEDIDWDVERVVAIDRVAAEAQARRGCQAWFYSLDFNEKCETVEYILTFLKRLNESAPAGFDRVQYIEQPTHRDLASHQDQTMHEAAKIKPVVIDESLIDHESLLLSREMGYSGVALKACKGQAEALLMGAAAQKHKMFLCVQDLTCPGYSFLHSSSLAARIPTVAAIEGNGRQYCPAGNSAWEERFPSMFKISDGTVGTGILTGDGLGFSRS